MNEHRKIVCHASGDRCLGCAHYQGKADECEFAPTLPGPAQGASIVPEAKFLLDRLQEFDPGDFDAERDFHGHVAPAIARLRNALSALPSTGLPAPAPHAGPAKAPAVGFSPVVAQWSAPPDNSGQTLAIPWGFVMDDMDHQAKYQTSTITSSPTPKPAETFETWFNRQFRDPDGGAALLPPWLKGDLRSAWDAALSSTQSGDGK